MIRTSMTSEQSRNTNEKKSVTFKETVAIFQISSKEEESEDKSLTERDYDLIQARCFRLVQVAHAGFSEKQLEEMGETTRGLENMTINHLKQGWQLRHSATQSVLLLQEEAQYNNPGITAERIAKVYGRLSAPSGYDASKRGIKDKAFVQSLLVKERSHRQDVLHGSSSRPKVNAYRRSYEAALRTQKLAFVDQQRYLLEQHQFHPVAPPSA